MKKMIYVVAMLLVSSIWCQAETFWYQALAGGGALKSYCLEQSVQANIGIGGGDDVVAIPSADQSVWVESLDPLKLPSLVASAELGVGVVSGSTEGLVKFCQFYSKDWQCMYYGYAEGRVAQLGDKKTLVWKDLMMKIPDFLRLTFPDGYDWGYVYLKYTDENGDTRYTYLGQGSEFMFPTAFAGKEGARLLVRGYTADGFRIEQVLDLETGDFLPIDEYMESFNSIVMDGISYHTDEVVEAIPSENSIGESPLFQLEKTVDGSLGISVKTSEGEYPTGFYWRQVGGEGPWGDWQYEQITYPGMIREKFYFPAGTYHLRFEWSSFHSESWKGMQWWNGNYDEGGKG